jgi:hypothetical protein
MCFHIIIHQQLCQGGLAALVLGIANRPGQIPPDSFRGGHPVLYRKGALRVEDKGIGGDFLWPCAYLN